MWVKILVSWWGLGECLQLPLHTVAGHAAGCLPVPSEKLRQERRYVSIFMRTSLYTNEPQYGNNANQTLMLSTQDTRDIVAAAIKALDSIWQDGGSESRYRAERLLQPARPDIHV